MKFDSKFTVQSTTTEGVSFTVRRLNTIQRAKLDMENLEQRVAYSEIWDQLEHLPKAPGAAEKGQPAPEDPDRIQRESLRMKADYILSIHIKPATLRHGLLKIEGLEIDGEPATTESLIQSGPSDLINEIWIAITNEAALTPEQRKNSQSPSTLDALEGGTNSTTSAATVETSVTT